MKPSHLVSAGSVGSPKELSCSSALLSESGIWEQWMVGSVVGWVQVVGIWHLRAMDDGQCCRVGSSGWGLVPGHVWHLRTSYAGLCCRVGSSVWDPVPGHVLLKLTFFLTVCLFASWPSCLSAQPVTVCWRTHREPWPAQGSQPLTPATSCVSPPSSPLPTSLCASTSASSTWTAKTAAKTVWLWVDQHDWVD